MKKSLEELKEIKKKNIDYISKFMEKNEEMEYMVYLGECNPRDTVEKIKHFLEQGMDEKDIWVKKGDSVGDFQVAVNFDKNSMLNQFKAWGAKGGKKKGESKVRGDSEYYRNIAKKRNKLTQT